MTKHAVPIAAVLALCVPALGQDFFRAVSPSQPTDDRLAGIRAAALAGDRSRIPALIQSLGKPQHPYEPYTAIHALVQLGATEAAGGIRQVAETSEDRDVRCYARVAAARMAAEAAVPAGADAPARAQAFLAAFQAQLGLEPAAWNAAAARQEEAIVTRKPDYIVGVEVYALRALADIIYRRGDAALADLVKRAGIDLEVDMPARVKLRYAPVPPALRAATLVRDLSALTLLNNERYYVLQLAIDEGLPASRLAAAAVREMDRERDRYHYIGFAALFLLFGALGDTTQEILVAGFLDDRDGWIRHYASVVYPNVKAGLRSQYRAGF